MTNDIVPNQAELIANPEAAIDACRRAFVTGEVGVAAAALQTTGLAMMAFAMQRLPAVEDAESLSRALVQEAQAQADEDERVLVDWAAHVCAALADTLRTMRALVACRFDLTANLASSTARHTGAAGEAWRQIVRIDPGLAEQSDLALAIGVIDRLPLLARMFDAQSQAQRHLLQGERGRYVEALNRVLSIVEDERRLTTPVRDAFAPVIRQLLAVAAEGVRAQLDFVARSMDTTDLARVEPSGLKVFIIHGHDEGAWRALKELLQNEFGLSTVVLKQEASGTRTLIQKFEAEAAECAFAIALVTPDDLVKKGKAVTLQARPNVLFELGWFYGRLGPGRMTIVQKGAGTALPSDLAGIVTLVYTQNVDEVLVDLRRELLGAGLVTSKPVRPARVSRKPAKAPASSAPTRKPAASKAGRGKPASA